MIRPLLLALALSAAPAAAAAPYYQVEPETAPTAARFVARDTVWSCGAQTCTAPQTGSRPAYVCAAVARELGVLRAFSAGRTAFGAEELEACNRRAR